MSRNIEKAIADGKNIISNHEEMNLRLSDLKYFGAMIDKKDGIFNMIAGAFYFGCCIGYRAKTIEKKKRVI